MIPNLPTDNLYKFIALSGLVILAFSVTYPLHLDQKVMILYDEYSLEKDQTRLEEDRLRYSIKALRESTEALQEKLSKVVISNEEVVSNISAIKENLKNEEYREQVKFMHEYGDSVIPYRSETIEKNKHTKELQDEIHQLKLKEIYIANLEERINHLFKRRKVLNFISWIGSVLGGVLAGVGFILWYFKVQQVLDLKLKFEMHDSSLRSKK